MIGMRHPEGLLGRPALFYFLISLILQVCSPYNDSLNCLFLCSFLLFYQKKRLKKNKSHMHYFGIPPYMPLCRQRLTCCGLGDPD